MSRPEVQRLLASQPALIPVYEMLEQWILGLPGTGVVYRKTQASFYVRRTFASAWLPLLPVKNRPEHYFVVSFYLDHKVVHPRMISRVEPMPGRWTHHVLVATESDWDDELRGWLMAASQWADRN